MTVRHKSSESGSEHSHFRASMASAVKCAVLIHPIAFVLVWLKGFVLGTRGGPILMASPPISGTVRYGFAGGTEAGLIWRICSGENSEASASCPDSHVNKDGAR